MTLDKMTESEKNRRPDRKHQLKRQLSTVLAAIVVFCTTYALILPAITIEQDSADNEPGIYLDEYLPEGEAPPVDVPSEQERLIDDAQGEDLPDAPSSDMPETDLPIDPAADESALVPQGDTPAVAAPSDPETPVNDPSVIPSADLNLPPEAPAAVNDVPTYPPQRFEQYINGLFVTAEAPEGALPADTYLQVSRVDREDAISFFLNAAETPARAYTLFDIRFFTSDDQEIEPLLPVRITLSSQLLADAETRLLLHLGEKLVPETLEPTPDWELPYPAAADQFIFELSSRPVLFDTLRSFDTAQQYLALTDAATDYETLRLIVDAHLVSVFALLDVTEVALPADPIIPSAELTDPTDPDTPDEPSLPADPEDLTVPTVPTDPENPEDPSVPSDPEDPSVFSDSSDPSDPENPENPEDPSAPSAPSDPSAPSEPEDPSNPDGVTEPTLSTEPLAPLAIPENLEKGTLFDTPPQDFWCYVNGMQVIVQAPAGAFPNGTSMQVTSITDADILVKLADAVDGDVQVQAVDIAFFDVEGLEIEPQLPIRVTMRAAALADADTATVVHMDNEGNTAIVEQTPVEETPEVQDAVVFDAESFSVYALVYTVDFHWEVDGKEYSFSLPGGGFMSFAHLAQILGLAEAADFDTVLDAAADMNSIPVSEATRQFVADVVSVELSDPSLIWIGKTDIYTTVGQLKADYGLNCLYSSELTEEQIAQINAQTVEAGDWALISLLPFETEETLTVTMKSGDVFVVRVTDEQPNPMGLDGNSYSIIGIKNSTSYALANTTTHGSASWGGSIDYVTATTVSGSAAATAWEFEWTGVGNEYLIHSGDIYLCITGTTKANGTLQLVSRDIASQNPIVVESIEGKYALHNREGNGLNIFGASTGNSPKGFWVDTYNTNGSNYRDFLVTLQSPANVSKPGTITTADTSGLLQINLFDYGPEANLDVVTNHISQGYGDNAWPYTSGLNSHQLKFYSYGTTGNGINNFTGDASVRSGIVANQLGRDNYPYLNTANSDVYSPESLGYLFGSGDNNVTAYNNLNHLFVLNEEGYYHYNSDNNYAFLTENGPGVTDFTVYSKTFPEEGADNQYFGVGFFPFNDYNEYYNCIHGRNFGGWHGDDRQKEGHYNHHFGMSLSGTFIMPPEGKYNGNDIIYEFSGDDDMWVFIDGVLILDVGGIHNPAHGIINFTDGVVTVNGVVQTDLRTKYKQVTGNDWDDSDFSQHDFRVFYIERGGMYSNLELTYNLPLTQKTNTGNISFDKVSSSDESLKLPGAKFALYTDSACEEPFTLASYPIESVSDEDGVVVFTNIPYGTYYMKETEFPEGYQEKDPAEVYTVVIGAGGTTITSPGGTPVEAIKNDLINGDLKLRKWVTIGGVSPADEPDLKTKADGEYTFTIAGIADTPTAGISRTVKIKIENGAAVKAWLDGIETVFDNSSDLFVVIPNLIPGNYTVKEEPTSIPDVWLSSITGGADDGSLDTRSITVTVTPGNHGSSVTNTGKATFTNNYRPDSEEDIAHISIKKTFEGLPDGTVFDDNFKITIEVGGNTYDLTSNPTNPAITFDGSHFPECRWTVSIKGLLKDAPVTITEVNAGYPAYDVTTSVNGTANTTTYTGSVSSSTVISAFDPVIYEANNKKDFNVTNTKIFIALLTDGHVLVISKNRLSLSERAAVEGLLAGTIYPGMGEANWHQHLPPYYYTADESRPFHFRGSEISYNNDTVHFDKKCQWTHTAEVAITYQPGNPADFNYVNTYTEKTVGVEILKVDANDMTTPLKGAGFVLSEIDPATAQHIDATVIYPTTSGADHKTGEDGKAAFNNLTEGYYEIRESVMPSGYVQTGDGVFFIRVHNGVVTLIERDPSSETGWKERSDDELLQFTAASGENAALATIGNTPGVALPSTGGIGTTIFYIVGAVLVLGAGVLLVTRKRMTAQ